jgi:sugar phosphate isomerase/epimerase
MELGVYSGCIVGDSLRDRFVALKEIGYDFLEYQVSPEDVAAIDAGFIDQMRGLSEEVGMPVRSTSMGPFSGFGAASVQGRQEERVAQVRRVVDLTTGVGGDVALLASWEPEGLDPAAVTAAYVAGLRACGEYAASRGVRLAVEHIGSSKFENTPSGLARVLRRVAHPAVGMYFDIGNSMHAGQDPLEALADVGPLVVQIHFKGYRAERPLPQMPLTAIRDALTAAGYTGRGAVEIGGKENNDHLRAALTTLRAAGL